MDLLDAADPGLPTAMIDAWRGAQAEVSLARDRLAAALDEQTPDSGRVRTRRVALAEAEQELDGHAERLRVADPRFWQLAGPRAADAVDPAAITASLADGDVVLTFSVDRPDLVSIALTRDGMASSGWSREERRLDALADHLVEACSRGEAWEHAAEELGTILLEPHADVLAAARRLHVIASGSLLTVPFPALRLRGRPLADHLVTSILPSLSAYPHLAAGRRQGLALCVGDPAQMSQRPAPESAPVPLAALPGARLEAEAVAALHGARPLVGPDATKSAVRGRLPDAAVVHLATHGLIDPTSPLASSVQLAQGEALTVAEILSMRLDADLVVLSACQTGTGARAGGDELLGLGRALVAAGARAVVVSLWPVNDACTAVLMSRFHADRVCGLPDDEALHEAQHWIRSLTMEQVHEELTHIARVGETTADYAPQELAATGLGAQRLVSTFRPVRPSPQLVPSHPMIWAPFVLVGR
jgi:CHAT domain-containing protein